jgi:IS5 family transposase
LVKPPRITAKHESPMRKTIAPQLGLVPPVVDHPHSRELTRMSEILDRLPQAAELVAKDLVKGTKATKAGRAGLTGEQVLRAALLKQMHCWSYEDLAFHLADSPTFRSFCRIGMLEKSPKKSALADNIKRVKPETLEEINKLVVMRAKKLGVENGKKVRVDSTVIDANIHHPLDSNLLYDVVRVLTRLLKRGAEMSVRIKFSNHVKRAKRRMLDVINARSMAHRVPIYRELLQITCWTLQYAADAAPILNSLSNISAWGVAAALEHYAELGNKVVDQTERRVCNEESVPAVEKIVSIFEPHTDVIVKDRRETLYGHKVFLNVGASGLIIDMLIERGNPADATRAVPMLERHRQLLGRAPEQAAFDAGFTSAANIESARKLGVKDASFAKKGSIDVLDGARSPKQHKKLQRFRAGVEGIISFTKRCFGFDRCLWRGYSSFRAYAWVSVLSTNLLLMARQTMS